MTSGMPATARGWAALIWQHRRNLPERERLLAEMPDNLRPITLTLLRIRQERGRGDGGSPVRSA